MNGLSMYSIQVVMVVRNIRRTMVEYHDILWDIGYAKNFDEAQKFYGQLYQERPPLEDFINWRDEHIMKEIHWYVLPQQNSLYETIFSLHLIIFLLLFCSGMDGSSITTWKEVSFSYFSCIFMLNTNKI